VGVQDGDIPKEALEGHPAPASECAVRKRTEQRVRQDGDLLGPEASVSIEDVEFPLDARSCRRFHKVPAGDY